MVDGRLEELRDNNAYAVVFWTGDGRLELLRPRDEDAPVVIPEEVLRSLFGQDLDMPGLVSAGTEYYSSCIADSVPISFG